MGKIDQTVFLLVFCLILGALGNPVHNNASQVPHHAEDLHGNFFEKVHHECPHLNNNNTQEHQGPILQNFFAVSYTW